MSEDNKIVVARDRNSTDEGHYVFYEDGTYYSPGTEYKENDRPSRWRIVNNALQYNHHYMPTQQWDRWNDGDDGRGIITQIEVHKLLSD